MRTNEKKKYDVLREKISYLMMADLKKWSIHRLSCTNIFMNYYYIWQKSLKMNQRLD